MIDAQAISLETPGLSSQLPIGLLSRALDSATSGIVIADARLPDHPLIYVNAAFETITGYSRSDVLGRNCRFLQGGATDRETVAEIRSGARRRR